MKNHPVVIFTMIFSVVMCFATDAAADNKKEEKKSKTDEALVVFPIEGVNLGPRIVNASTEILNSSLANAGFKVYDWRLGLEKLESEKPKPAQEPTVAPPSEPVPKSAPVEPAPSIPEETPMPEAAPSPVTPAPVLPAPQMAPVSTPPQPPIESAPAFVELTPALKQQITEALGCSIFVDGKMIKLGSKVRISIYKKSADSAVLEHHQLEAKSEDDIVIALERIAAAFASDSSADDTLNLDNATNAETSQIRNRFKLEKHFGAMIGQTISVNDNMKHFTMLGFDARLELKDVLVDVYAGFSIVGGEDPGADIFANLSAAYYLSHTGVSPYLGAGAGIFFGDMGGRYAGENNEDDDDDDSSASLSNVGFDLFPLFGLEFLRNSSIRVHMDFRYTVCINPDTGKAGHGPTMLIGINF